MKKRTYLYILDLVCVILNLEQNTDQALQV